ncbi:MAG: alanine--glyoxylate aminotransferase family protein [bacterium]
MKKYLMTPGPTTIPEDVLLEMAKPIIHHRTGEYQEIIKRVSEDLKYIFQTQNPVLMFASSGTGGMEASVCNLLSQSDIALVVESGKFGERWGEICKAYKIQTEIIKVEPGDSVSPLEIKERLSKKKFSALFTTLCETSTGALTDIEAIGEITKKLDTLFVVDAISGLCADEFLQDSWKVDVCVSSSQKGLMLPPGLSFVSLSKKAQEKIEKGDLPKYYFSFKKALKAYENNDTPFTPAISLVRGLATALSKIRKEGIENIIKRHKRLAEATRNAVSALGLTLFAKNPSNAVTSVLAPDGIPAKNITSRIKNTYGVNIAKGQGKLEDVIFRIAHLGYVDKFDIITTISALEMTLSDLGFPVKLGLGVGEIEKALKE